MLQIEVHLDNTIVLNQRRIYSFNNLLVDVGGIMKSIVTILAFISYPTARFLFTLKSTKRLFFA